MSEIEWVGAGKADEQSLTAQTRKRLVGFMILWAAIGILAVITLLAAVTYGPGIYRVSQGLPYSAPSANSPDAGLTIDEQKDKAQIESLIYKDAIKNGHSQLEIEKAEVSSKSYIETGTGSNPVVYYWHVVAFDGASHDILNFLIAAVHVSGQATQYFYMDQGGQLGQ